MEGSHPRFDAVAGLIARAQQLIRESHEEKLTSRVLHLGDETRIDAYDSKSGRLRKTTRLFVPGADPYAPTDETVHWPDGELPIQTDVDLWLSQFDDDDRQE